MTTINFGVGPLLRSNLIAGFATLAMICLCWLYLLSGAGMAMDILEMSVFGIPSLVLSAVEQEEGMQMSTVMIKPSLFGTTTMWWLMMIAMMLPGTLRHLPVLGSTSIRVSMSLGMFLSGYAAIWLGFSLIATAMQYGLVSVNVLHPTKMWSTNALFSIILLCTAGAVQLTKTKAKHLFACQQQPTSQSPWKLGLKYGAHCLFASFFLMCLLFVGGVMNIFWIVGLSLIVTVEKLLPAPRLFSAAIGLIFIFAAATIVISTI